MTRHTLQSIYTPLFSLTASLTSTTATAKQCPACKRPWRRQFSSTPSRDITKLRNEMFAWLNTRGKSFQYPVENNTNYLTDYDRQGFRRDDEDGSKTSEGTEGPEAGRQADASGRGRNSRKRPRQPFPLNEHFISSPILSEGLREEIWRRITVDKKSIRNVSVELGVEMRRVGAVVRLMEVEKQWRAEVRSHTLPTHPYFDFS